MRLEVDARRALLADTRSTLRDARRTGGSLADLGDLDGRNVVASDPDFPLKMSSLLSMAGGALLLAGSVCKRWSVFKAGFQSAEDSTRTVETQRAQMNGARGA